MANNATLDSIIAIVRNKLIDNQANKILTDDEYSTAISSALDRFSSDRPPTFVSELAGNGKSFYKMADLAPMWADAESSSIVQLEYPAVTLNGSTAVQNFIDSGSYSVQVFPDGGDQVEYLVLGNNTVPSASETMRVTITVPHSLNGLANATVTTFSDATVDALCNLCAAVVLQTYATKFARMAQPTIQADHVDSRNLVSDVLSIADRFLTSYTNYFGLAADGAPAGTSSFLQWNTHSHWAGSWMFHNNTPPY